MARSRVALTTTFGALALLTACSAEGFEGTVACRGDRAEFRFDPSDGAEVHGAGEKLGWADADGRGLDDEHCERVTTQTEWFVGMTYEHTSEPVTLRCRLPGRFYLQAHPTFSSESGELFPDGSSIYLVIEKKRTIVASAGVGEDPATSTISFSRRYCTPA
jgi:hypothetical protein